MKIAATCLLLAVSVVGVGACRRDRTRESDRSSALSERDRSDWNEQDRSGTTTLTGADWVGNDVAIERIVVSRCAREVTCSNVGPDKHFTTESICSRDVKARTTNDLKPSECPSGIDGRQLDKCLDKIRSESCSNVVDTLARLVECRARDLCMKSEIPHR